MECLEVLGPNDALKVLHGRQIITIGKSSVGCVELLHADGHDHSDDELLVGILASIIHVANCIIQFAFVEHRGKDLGCKV